jgi:hypothetical protein
MLSIAGVLPRQLEASTVELFCNDVCVAFLHLWCSVEESFILETDAAVVCRQYPGLSSETLLGHIQWHQRALLSQLRLMYETFSFCHVLLGFLQDSSCLDDE